MTGKHKRNCVKCSRKRKWQHLPSDERKEKTIRVSPDKMKAVAIDHTRPYMILKNDGYREGDTVKLIEFAEGRATGNTADMKIIWHGRRHDQQRT